MAWSRKGGITDTVMETGMAREGRWGRNRDRNGRRGGRLKRGGQLGPGSKRIPLVEDVSKYWEA